MFLGHYAVALAARRASPRLSLGTTIFAAQFLDELWPALLIAGVEHVRIVPGLMAASALDFTSYPYSHSLLTTLLWALLVGGGHYAARRRGRDALILGAAVASHWFLDAPMHRPDLPLWPGSTTLVGGGLWNSVAATLAIELSLLAVGVGLYVRGTRARDRIGRWGLWTMVTLLVVFWLGGLSSPPADERVLAYGALTLWLFVPFGWWIDRHRAPAESALGRGDA